MSTWDNMAEPPVNIEKTFDKIQYTSKNMLKLNENDRLELKTELNECVLSDVSVIEVWYDKLFWWHTFL